MRSKTITLAQNDMTEYQGASAVERTIVVPAVVFQVHVDPQQVRRAELGYEGAADRVFIVRQNGDIVQRARRVDLPDGASLIFNKSGLIDIDQANQEDEDWGTSGCVIPHAYLETTGRVIATGGVRLA